MRLFLGRSRTGWARVAFTFLAIQAAMAMAQTRVAVRTMGQIESDGSALYSVYVATGAEDLGEVLVAAEMPRGTRFLEQVHKPESAVYDGVQKDTIFWSVARIERETLLGPFVYRVKRDGKVTSQTAKKRRKVPDFPDSVYSVVTYQKPVSEYAEAPAGIGVLEPLANIGTIIVDQRGTLDESGRNGPAFVGGTGVLLFVPNDAVSQPVKITITRIPYDDSKVPRTDPPTWWCALYLMTSTPEIAFSKPVKFALPTRRAVTPGIPVSMFVSPGISGWTKNSGLDQAPGAGTPWELGFGIGSCTTSLGGLGFGGFGGFGAFGGGFTVCSSQGFGFGGFGAFGYVEQDNLVSKSTSAKLSQFGTTALSAVTSPPSIIAILIGIR